MTSTKYERWMQLNMLSYFRSVGLSDGEALAMLRNAVAGDRLRLELERQKLLETLLQNPLEAQA